MVLYSVELTVDEKIAVEFLRWLDQHIQEILKLDGFLGATLFNREDQTTTHKCWTVHYQLRDRQALDNYFNLHAQAFRLDGLNRFGKFFSATRQNLTKIKNFDK